VILGRQQRDASLTTLCEAVSREYWPRALGSVNNITEKKLGKFAVLTPEFVWLLAIKFWQELSE